jgi:predicted SAM-dependent methyltransferase
MNNLKVDLGAGPRKRKGYQGYDIRPLDGIDVVGDLTNGIPLPDKCCLRVYTSHFLEHIPADDMTMLFREVRRVLQDNGTFTIRLPYVQFQGAFYPGHVTQPGQEMMFFDHGVFNECFKIVAIGYIYDKNLRNKIKTELPSLSLDTARQLFWNLTREIVLVCRPKCN